MKLAWLIDILNNNKQIQVGIEGIEPSLTDSKTVALPLGYIHRPFLLKEKTALATKKFQTVAALTGLEPITLWLTAIRSNQLSYRAATTATKHNTVDVYLALFIIQFRSISNRTNKLISVKVATAVIAAVQVRYMIVIRQITEQ